MDRKKYRNRYQYQNNLAECPNCGKPLSKTDIDCPACGINLVGHNEKQNMAHNMTSYAEEMQDIVSRNDALNQKIREENRKQQNKEIKKGKRKVFIAICIIAIIVSAIAFAAITSLLNEVTAQSDDELVDYLQTTAITKKNVDACDIDDLEIKKEINYDQQEYEITTEVGVDQTHDITVIKERYTDDDNEYTILRCIPSEIANLPKVEIFLDKISYHGYYSFIYFNDYFLKTEEPMTVDEVFLQERAYKYQHHVSRLPTFIIDDTEIYLYDCKTEYGAESNGDIVAIVPLSNDMFYVSTVDAEKTTDGEDIVRKNLEKYFHIIVEED